MRAEATGRNGRTIEKRSRLQLFARDKRGASAVEFALVAVPFLGLLAMIFNTGLLYLFERNLDAAVQNAARQVRTGAVQAASPQNAAAFVSGWVCPANKSLLGSFINCNNLIVDIRTATAFTGNDMSNGYYKTQQTNQFCLGAPGQITIIRVAYPMPWFIPVITYGQAGIAAQNAGLVNDVPGALGQWFMIVSSVALLRTEPYPSGQYTKNQGC